MNATSIKKPASRYSYIIVTYNSENEIGGLLEDLSSKRHRFPIIIVDNASADGTVKLIRRNFPWVTLVENRTDTGYARAVNQGFNLCDSEYFFLLNPDIRLPDRHVADILYETINHHPEVAAVAPLQFIDSDQKRRLNFTWSYWSPRAFSFFLTNLLQQGITKDDPIQVTYLNAGCLFIRSSAFRTVNMFNEKYFLYGEEPDLFLKFKCAGFISLLHPDTYVLHQRERSMKSLSDRDYLVVKLRGAVNILDALFNGWINILRSGISNRKSI